MTQTTKPPATGGAAVAAVDRRSWFATLDWRRYVIYIGFVVVFLFFAVLLGDQGFLSANNLLNILRQTATITVIAVAMTYVIACAEIDLSVGSVAGLASVVTAMAVANWGVVAGVLAGLAVGVVVGSINGALVGRAEHPLVPGHARHARDRGRHGAVDHRLRAAADPVLRLQPRLRLRQYGALPWAGGVDGDLRRGRELSSWRRPASAGRCSPPAATGWPPSSPASTPSGSSSRCC